MSNAVCSLIAPTLFCRTPNLQQYSGCKGNRSRPRRAGFENPRPRRTQARNATPFASKLSPPSRLFCLDAAREAGVQRLKSMSQEIPVTMAEGPHPFPFRTRPLSPPAPMILHTSGKVGCRRVKFQESRIGRNTYTAFLFLLWYAFHAMKPKADIYWRKALLAARILVRSREGRLTARDRRIAKVLGTDPGVTDRLLDQAMAVLKAEVASRVVA
jgi:hypothetical protein